MSTLQKLLSLFLLLVVISCSEQVKEVTVNAEPIQTVDTLPFVQSTKKFVDYTDSINCTDQHGRKQGAWLYENHSLGWEVKVHYQNDTLHGVWSKTSQGFLDSGRFVNGKLSGFLRDYYPKKHEGAYSQMMGLKLVENDTIVWLMYPASDFGREYIRKGIHVSSDSVTINAPYENGQVAYQGVFINYEAVGNHYSYYPNGELFQTVNYGFRKSKNDTSETHFIKNDTVQYVLKVHGFSNPAVRFSIRYLKDENIKSFD
jgi:hypothetical protein